MGQATARSIYSKDPAKRYRQLEHRRACRIELERRACQRSLAYFTKSAWEYIEPGKKLLWNWHLDTICGYLEALGERRIHRLIINVPPGAMKSILVSVMYPAWVWTKHPERRFLCVANGDTLATRDALAMKAIVTSAWYQHLWPTPLLKDQNEKTLFLNNRRGFRQSIGISAKITGKRGDDLIMDDLLDAKDAFSDVERHAVNQAYDQKLVTRVNDEVSGQCLIMQRLHVDDLTGHLLKLKASPWVHLSIPMRYEGHPTYNAKKDIGRPDLADPRREIGELMFPARFSDKGMNALAETLGEYGMAGQMQQRPIPLGGGILKKKWWRIWTEEQMPDFEHVFLSWDTAYSEPDMKGNAFSGYLKLGIFFYAKEGRYCVMLMGRWLAQVDYPDLRARAIEETKNTKPDAHLIEKKASGISLVQDLRRAGVSVRTYMPDRDKISRAYAVQAMLSSGQVWAPQRKWAGEIIDLVANFPHGNPPTADATDMLTQALLYLRNGWWVEHPDDEKYDAKPRRLALDDDDMTEHKAYEGGIYG